MRKGLLGLPLLRGPLDRRALAAFFLGGVVPFATLVALLNVMAPGLLRKPWMLLLLGSLAALSLAAFLALRRTMDRALEAVDAENRTLRRLLDAARSLVSPDPDGGVPETLARSVAELLDAELGFFVEVRRDGEARVRGSTGGGADRMRSDVEAAGRRLAGETAGAEVGAPVPVTIGGAAGLAMRSGAGEGWRGVLVALGHDVAADDKAHASAAAALAALGSVALNNERLRSAQRNFFSHVTNFLVSALDTHMATQEDHSRRVARTANLIGRHLHFDEERLQALHFASLLHDIGMLRLPPTAIGRDAAATRRHPELGAEVLAPIDLWRPLAKLVLHHHEWWDGTGYPRGLAGESIPLESRIIAIAEAYDSMTAQGGYQTPVPVDEALRRIEGGAGTQFDPDLVRLFLDLARAGALS